MGSLRKKHSHPSIGIGSRFRLFPIIPQKNTKKARQNDQTYAYTAISLITVLPGLSCPIAFQPALANSWSRMPNFRVLRCYGFIRFLTIFSLRIRYPPICSSSGSRCVFKYSHIHCALRFASSSFPSMMISIVLFLRYTVKSW